MLGRGKLNEVITLEVRHSPSDILISREEIFDRKISAAAFRLHVTLLALAQNEHWEFYQSGLAKIFDTRRETISRWVGELKKAGYMEIIKQRNERQRFTGVILWVLYDCQQGIWLKRYERESNLVGRQHLAPK